MKPYSYHVFYFPFKWDVKGIENKVFSEQICLDKISYCSPSYWKRVQQPESPDEQVALYNEKNYYYEFVHKVLYDEPGNTHGLIRHFERLEPQTLDVSYLIKVKGRPLPYRLKVAAINLNLYATGVGFMSFYLENNDVSQRSPEDILTINQYGRRIMPPFYGDIEVRDETSEYIAVEGLLSEKSYKEDFCGYTSFDSWKPASFITNLIFDLAENIVVEPIIDDRMFVASWYKNDKLAGEFEKDAQAFCNTDKSNQFSVFWYKYLFVDKKYSETCQNDKMRKELLEKHTYVRWQKWSSLYGVSRYSCVYLASDKDAPQYLFDYFQTIYARMIELVLVQRASMLRFSNEVTKVSDLSNVMWTDDVFERVNSLHREYIRFINQIYFREVTSQDQGIEIYKLLHTSLNMEGYIKDLDGEISELHDYVSLKEERNRSVNAERLNNIATLFLPITVITGFWGMNEICDVVGNHRSILIQGLILVLGLIVALVAIFNKNKKI